MPIPWGTVFFIGSSLISSFFGRKKAKDSPAYTELELDISQDMPIPIVYGKGKVRGHIVFREDTYDKEYDFAIGLCEGEANEISNVRIGDRIIEDVGDSSYTIYKGTSDQAGDDIFKKGVIVMPCTMDAYISEVEKDTNYNTTQLFVSYVLERRTYLKFSLTDMPAGFTITAAEIRLRKWTIRHEGTLNGYNLDDESWDEATLTWNNAPSTETQYLTNSTVKPGGEYGTIFFNDAGKKALKAAYNAGQSTFSVDIRAADDLNHFYYSKESDYAGAELVMTYSGATPTGFRNTAYIAMSVDNGAEQLSGRFPTVTAEVEGLKVSAYDGSSWGTAAYSNNPAWIIYDLLTSTRYGAGISSTLIDAASFKTVADYCDGSVTLANGETEKRYMCDLVIDTRTEAVDALTEMLSTFGGFLYYHDGTIYLGVEKNETSAHTFDVTNILHGTFSYQQIEKNGIPNIVRITYTEPREDYKQVYIQVESEIDRADMGARVAELRILGITRQSQALRRANWILWRGLLAEYTCQFRVSIKHSHITAGDVCSITHTLSGWSAKEFRVVEVFEYSNDELQITCEEYIEVTTALEQDLPETSYYTRTGGENTLLAAAPAATPTWTLISIEGGWRVVVTGYVEGTLKYELYKYSGAKKGYRPYATFAETRNSSGDGALVYDAHAADPSVQTYGKFKLRVITATDQSELSDSQEDYSKADTSLIDADNFVPTMPDESGTYPTLTAKEVSGGDFKFIVTLKVILPSGYEDGIVRVEMQRRDNDGGSYNEWIDLPPHLITVDPAPSVVYWKNSDAILIPGVTYQWRARCVARGGTESAWTTALSETIVDDTTAPAQPTISVVALPLGNLLTIVGGTEADFAYFKIEGSSNAGSDWSTLVEKQVLTVWIHGITTAGIDTTWRYRVTAYDWVGNASTVSAATADYGASKIVTDVVFANTFVAGDMAFVVAGTTNVIGLINASSEGGGTLNIAAAKIAISGSTTFTAGYNPTNNTWVNVGGKYSSAASGARVLVFPDANTGIQIIDDAAADVFKVIVGGSDVGDVIIGSTAGQHVKWDKSASTLFINAILATAGGIKTSTGGGRIELGKYGEELDALTAYSGGVARLKIFSSAVASYDADLNLLCQQSSGGLSGWGAAVIDFESLINSDTGFYVSANQVVGARKASVADADVVVAVNVGGGADSVDRTTLNSDLVGMAISINTHTTAINAIIARLQVTGGHGLNADA